MKKYLLVLGVIALGGAVYTQRGPLRDAWIESKKPNVEAVSYQEVVAEKESEEPENIEEPKETPVTPVTPITPVVPVTTPVTNEPDSSTIPTQYNLAVPFTSQAPHSNWDEVHEETCEEASVLMAAYYYQQKPPGTIDPDEAEAQLQQLIAFENATFGYAQDTDAAETALILENYFHLSAELVYHPTIEELKQALVNGYPIIVPAAGRRLGNPNFTPPGPLYHMFLVKGYTEDSFITNDPGTRLGADYVYSFDVLMNAIHDWNNGDVENGATVVIIVKP